MSDESSFMLHVACGRGWKVSNRISVWRSALLCTDRTEQMGIRGDASEEAESPYEAGLDLQSR